MSLATFLHHLKTIDSVAGRCRTRKRKVLQNRIAPAAHSIELLESRIAPAAAFSQFVDPHPSAGNQFGATVVALSTGNIVVTAPFDDIGALDAGAVYLFSGIDGHLIS